MATGYHENQLSEDAKNFHRCITSLIEELEAVDWYNQRVDVTGDETLAAILRHNRDEEVEHACMALEWLRRRYIVFDEELRTYLFTKGPIDKLEEQESGEEEDEKDEKDGSSSSSEEGKNSSLNIRNMKGEY